MQSARRVVKRLFSKYLLVTNTCASSCLLGVGDAVMQRIEMLDKPEKRFDKHRAGRMMSMGLLFGPLSHGWYKILDKFFPGKTLKIVAKKIFSDQLVAGPFFCSAFFMGMSLLEGRSIQSGVEEVKEKFITVYMIDWCLWPPAQFINFFFLPTQYRVVYVSMITLLWNVFLSWIKHREHVHTDHAS